MYQSKHLFVCFHMFVNYKAHVTLFVNKKGLVEVLNTVFNYASLKKWKMLISYGFFGIESYECKT